VHYLGEEFQVLAAKSAQLTIVHGILARLRDSRA